MSAAFSIMGKAFNQMRLDADEVLNKAVRNMVSQNQDDAEIVIKIKIKVAEEDPFIPEFEHAVSSVLKLKTEKKGSAVGKTELEWDENRKRYVVVSEDRGQMSFDDLREEQREEGPMPDLSDEEEDAIVYGRAQEEEYTVGDAEPIEIEELPEGFRALPPPLVEDQEEDEDQEEAF